MKYKISHVKLLARNSQYFQVIIVIYNYWHKLTERPNIHKLKWVTNNIKGSVLLYPQIPGPWFLEQWSVLQE